MINATNARKGITMTNTTTMMTRIDTRSRAIICTDDNKMFYSIVEAASYYGLTRHNINNVLHGRSKSAGGLHFRYATEEEIPTIKKNITVQREAFITGEGKRTNGNCNAVLCIDTGEIFSSGTDAAEKFGTTPANMSRACRNKGSRTAGHRFCYVKDINEYVDSISNAINKANAYDILVARDATRKELIATVDQKRETVDIIEYKLCELQKELEEAKRNLICAEHDLRNFDA